MTPFPFQDVVRRLFLTDVSEESLVSVLQRVGAFVSITWELRG